MFPEPVILAAYEYIQRQRRASHPDGTFDRAKRWYPSPEEERPCCASIRRPSGSYPYSLMTHCRTAGHVAALYGVDAREVRRALRAEAWKIIEAEEVLSR
ncbi:hypothetical protein [Candidatus Darwinibacter acetoxidans]